MALSMQIEERPTDTSLREYQNSPRFRIEEQRTEAMRHLVQELGDDAGALVNIEPLLRAGARAAEDLRWLEYIETLAASSPAARTAKRFWNEARVKIGLSLRAPLTVPEDDGAIHLAWDAGQHYFDIDILADGNAEWFYRDRASGTLDGTERGEPVFPLSASLLRRLKLVAQ